MDEQIKPIFPRVKRLQLCHYQTDGGFVNGYVSQSFDEGFVVTLDNDNVVRFLRHKWDETDANTLLWLTRNGKPMKRRWYQRG